MEIKEVNSQSTVRSNIQQCSDKEHVQQVAYSTYHDVLTQICFDCQEVWTTLENAKNEGYNL